MHELRRACRAVVRSPGYSAPILLTFALTIGATSAIFSAVYAVLLKPLPIRMPSELVIGWVTAPTQHLVVVELPYRAFERLAASNRSFSHLAAMGSTTWPAVLKGRGEPVRLASVGVSASFFETLGAVPVLGRTFTAADDLKNAPRVAVLSHNLWAIRFGRNPNVVGTRIDLDDQLHTVVGVMPAGFEFPRGAELWTPVVAILAGSSITWQTDNLETVGVLFLLGRLRHDVTPAMARDDLSRLQTAHPSNVTRDAVTVVLTPLLDFWLGPIRKALWALFAAVGIFLLVGCANVSGLMLARMSWRRAEQAIHLALGATRGRLMRRWLMEIGILSLAGGSAGLAASFVITRAIVALAPDDLPRLSEVAVNTPVVLFSFVVIIAAAVISGVGPARHAASWSPEETLVEAGRITAGKRAQQIRSGLVAVQIGLAIVLLVAAALVLRSFVNLRRIDLGFDPAQVVTMKLSPENPQPSANAWMDRLLRRLRELPGVENAGAVYLRPLELGPIGQETGVLLEGQVLTRGDAYRNPALSYQVAMPQYFETMKIRLVRGRLFDARDDPRAPRVAIVSEGAARRLWPGQDPVGRKVLLPTFVPGSPDPIWRTVVGVVGDVRYRRLDDVRLDVYDAGLQAALPASNIVVRSSGNPRAVAGAVQAEARRMDAHVLVDGVTTLDAVVTRAVAPWRFSMWILTVFAALAFVLSTVGLFGTLSLDVATRRREFAVRLALGAQYRHIAGAVLFSAATRVLAGTFIGVALATVGTRAIASMLFGVALLDLRTYLAVITLVWIVVTVASYLPARRAALTDPLPLLRRP